MLRILEPARDFNPNDYVSIKVGSITGLASPENARQLIASSPSEFVRISENGITIGEGRQPGEITGFFSELKNFMVQQGTLKAKYEGENVLLADNWVDPAFRNPAASITYPRELRTFLGLPAHNVGLIAYMRSSRRIHVVSSIRHGETVPREVDYICGGGMDAGKSLFENLVDEAAGETGKTFAQFVREKKPYLEPLDTLRIARTTKKGGILQTRVMLFALCIDDFKGPFTTGDDTVPETYGHHYEHLGKLLADLNSQAHAKRKNFHPGRSDLVFKFDYPAALVRFAIHMGVIKPDSKKAGPFMEAFDEPPALSGLAPLEPSRHPPGRKNGLKNSQPG